MQLLLTSGSTTPPQKYIDHRSEIKNGDIILYRGKSIMSKAIQYFDSAYYNHAGVVWIPENSNRILTLDMWSGGLDCLPLSRRMSDYQDFCIIRPKVTEIDAFNGVETALSLWDGRDVKYDFLILLRIAIVKKTGIDITGLQEKNTFICSQFAQYYAHLLGLHNYDNIPLLTPQDILRYIDANYDVLLNDHS
jgi:hypothetical protein